MKKLLKIVPYLAIAILVGVTVVSAGSLTPPGSVANTMYSLTDIYNLGVGTTASEGIGVIETTPTTIAETGYSLTDVYTTISTEIAKLANAKIAKNVTAFGYTGTLYGDTDPAKVLTTAAYAGTAVAGTPPTEWAAADMSIGTQSWTAGDTYCTGLGGGWRLPYLWELSKISLEGYTTGSIGLGGSAGLGNGYYWSGGTINIYGPTYANFVQMSNGYVGTSLKTEPDTIRVRCAR